jgi:peptide/nickel transport system substrate-binding protein
LVLFSKKEQKKKNFFFEKKKQKTFALLSYILAGGAAPCGTIIIPNGIGLGPPAAPTTLNPLLAGDTDSLQEAILLYRPLVWIGQKSVLDTAESLADTIAVRDGGARLRVTLKPWTWSDGAPLTADDVLFGWQSIVALKSLYPSAGQGGIPDRVAAVQIIDPHTVDFVLAGATNPQWFILNGLPLLYALPRHAWPAMDADTMWRRQNDPTLFTVVDGPFRLTDFQPDRYAAFAANPLYGGHKPNYARLVTPFLEGASALHALQAGDIDMARVPYALWDRLKAAPHLHGVVLPEPFGYWDLLLNQAGPMGEAFRDARLRVALADAIDQQQIIRLVYHGFGTENHLPAPTQAAWRDPRYNETPVRYDPQAAAAALQAAGWLPGPDGVRMRGATRLDITVLTQADPDDAEMQMLQLVQADLRKIGVRLRLRAISSSLFNATVYGNNGTGWEAASTPITPTPFPDGTAYWNTGGASNFSAFSDPRIDALIRDGVEKPGLQALFAFQAYAARLQPAVFLPQGKQLLMVSNRLHGVEDFANELGYWRPQYLSVDDPACHGAAPGAARR